MCEDDKMSVLVNSKIKYFFLALILCISLFTCIAAVFIVLKVENAAIYIFLCMISMAFSLIALCYRYFSWQDKIFENASGQIAQFISGNNNVRINCDQEGKMYRFFHDVNILVSILNARAENEVKSKEFLKRMISDISHQLKTPLAALNIYNGIMMDETDNIGTIHQFIDLSEQELDRIEVLVQNFLKITKFDAGTIVMDKKIENLADMMEVVRKHFTVRAELEGKKIILSGNSNVTLLCDKIWMMEAVDNIVKNALDHTKKGDVVQVEWKHTSAFVQIIISDNGSGIHSEDVHYIFKRFYRSRFSKDTKGVGLGLSLTKSIIEEHNGTVEVYSELGVGTSFTIIFLNSTQ